MSEATQWTALLLRKQQADPEAQAERDAAAKDNAERLGRAAGQLAAGLGQDVAEPYFRKKMDEWKLQRMADHLRREQTRQMADVRQRQGMATAQPQPGLSGQSAMPAQSAPQPRPGPGPAVITVPPPPPKTSYLPGMIIRNPETGERLKWGGSEWMLA